MLHVVRLEVGLRHEVDIIGTWAFYCIPMLSIQVSDDLSSIILLQDPADPAAPAADLTAYPTVLSA